MFPNDPQYISSVSDLKEVAAQMKAVALYIPDTPLELYSKTPDEALPQQIFARLSPEDVENIQKSGGVRIIVLEGGLYSLVLSQDDYNGHQWHLSMAQIIPNRGVTTPSEKIGRYIAGSFFDDWESTPNPGMFKALHFAGSDHKSNFEERKP